MLFMEDHVRAVLPALEARRDHCDALVGVLSAGEVVRLTRLGSLKMDGSDKGPIAMLKRLRGARGKGGAGSSGAGQMAMLRRLPKLLRFIPGPAQDLRAYFLTMQYWLSGSQDNVADMVRYLVGRYAGGPRAALRGRVEAAQPRSYPEVGVYHPRARGRIAETLDALLPPAPAGASAGTVGVLVLRSYVLADDTGHYDGVIAAWRRRACAWSPPSPPGWTAAPPSSASSPATAAPPSTRWSPSPASPWSAAPPTTTRARRRRCWPGSTSPTSSASRWSSSPSRRGAPRPPACRRWRPP